MPKRVIDFDALWASDKLAACAEWAQAEYAWFYGLADASGSFELTNLRVIWGRVAAVRKNLTLQRLTEIFEEFMQRGLLFTWEQNGKRYGHWTGSDVPGRLPPPSWRMRLERLAPPVPRDQLAAYLARTGGRAGAPGVECAAETAASAGDCANESGSGVKAQLELKLGVEAPQAQEWDVDLNLDWKGNGMEPQVCANAQNHNSSNTTPPESELIEQMVAVYEAERGSLPPADRPSMDTQRRCLRLLAEGITLEDFRVAVQRAAATPFLAGAGGRGWCASFDWLVANEENIRKILAGRYEPAAQHAAAWAQDGWRTRTAKSSAVGAARVGMGPLASAVGVRVNPAALERIRAREELRANGAISVNNVNTATDKEKAS